MRYFLLLLCCALTGQLSAAGLNYELSFTEPQAHYADVNISVSGCRSRELVISMPVWAPGSYLVREFTRFVEEVKATDGANGKTLPLVKLSKNSWKISTGGASALNISYRVYAYELSVRTSFIDAEHAYLNGTSIFMKVSGFEQSYCTVKVNPYASWKKMSVALNPVLSNPWLVAASDYDELVDAPFEIGNHLVFSFTSSGVPHEVAMFGEGNFDVERLKKDMARITAECAAVFGEHPCKRYVFIIHNLTSGGGGLEHKNSTTLQTNRWSYSSESGYNGFLSLVAHEYFHLWNVKRLRPVPLGPFDYNQENYTTLLWIAEGFTAYYDDLIVKRCGFTSENEYLKTLAGNISYAVNIKGAPYQSLSESSFDAWIKYYRSWENANNSTVSYYTKGGVVGAMLDLSIRKETGGKASLDDVFREMYLLYAKKLDRAYTEQEFIAMVNKVCGKDMSGFFRDYVNGTKMFPFAAFMGEMGMKLTDLNAGQSLPYLGITSGLTSGKLTVTGVDRGSPAWTEGVNVNDELIALDDYRLSDDLSKFLAMKTPGEKVKLLVSRSGYLKSFLLEVKQSPFVKFTLESAGETSAPLKGWLTTHVN